jgi:hypothetical protein
MVGFRKLTVDALTIGEQFASDTRLVAHRHSRDDALTSTADTARGIRVLRRISVEDDRARLA